MKKIKVNWKEIFKTKKTFMAFVTAIITFVYFALSLMNIIPAISQENAINWFGQLASLLMIIGVFTNSNTKRMTSYKELLSNKTTLSAFITLLVSFIYFTLSLFNIVPNVDEKTLLELLSLLMPVLAALGIVTNSNTPGIGE